MVLLMNIKKIIKWMVWRLCYNGWLGVVFKGFSRKCINYFLMVKDSDWGSSNMGFNWIKFISVQVFFFHNFSHLVV